MTKLSRAGRPTHRCARRSHSPQALCMRGRARRLCHPEMEPCGGYPAVEDASTRPSAPGWPTRRSFARPCARHSARARYTPAARRHHAGWASGPSPTRRGSRCRRRAPRRRNGRSHHSPRCLRGAWAMGYLRMWARDMLWRAGRVSPGHGGGGSLTALAVANSWLVWPLWRARHSTDVRPAYFLVCTRHVARIPGDDAASRLAELGLRRRLRAQELRALELCGASRRDLVEVCASAVGHGRVEHAWVGHVGRSLGDQLRRHLPLIRVDPAVTIGVGVLHLR